VERVQIKIGVIGILIESFVDQINRVLK